VITALRGEANPYGVPIELSVTGAWDAWQFYRSSWTLREAKASTRAATGESG
jgi:hypothetical protein